MKEMGNVKKQYEKIIKDLEANVTNNQKKKFFLLHYIDFDITNEYN